MLVDYGISCPHNPGPDFQRYDPEAQRTNVTGTLSWASLNAHRGCCKQLHLTDCNILFLDDFVRRSFMARRSRVVGLHAVLPPQSRSALGKYRQAHNRVGRNFYGTSTQDKMDGLKTRKRFSYRVWAVSG